MLLSVAVEVLDYRRRTPRVLSATPAMYLKAVMVVLSFVLPFISPTTAIIYGVVVVALMVVIGLRRTSAYIAASIPIIYLTLLASAIVLQGDVTSVTRFTAFATATAPTFTFAFATTKPSTLRRIPVLYLLSVVFSSVIREVLDISMSYKAKGSSGLDYWMRIVVAAVAVSGIRAQTLSDALKARGFEVVE